MRASRLLSILLLLQARGRMTAEALASEFEVSVRTIYRDVDQLSAADVPIYADRGPSGGFQLLDGYRTRLTGLSPAEAETLSLARLPGLVPQCRSTQGAADDRHGIVEREMPRRALPARRGHGRAPAAAARPRAQGGRLVSGRAGRRSAAHLSCLQHHRPRGDRAVVQMAEGFRPDAVLGHIITRVRDRRLPFQRDAARDGARLRQARPARLAGRPGRRPDGHAPGCR